MFDKRYAIGVDFGTLSARAVVVDVSNGEETGESVFEYPHGVMEFRLPCGTPLKDKSALQHPMDYIEALRQVIPDAMKKAGVSAGEICGLGIDFTSCTIIPVFADATPLCFDERFSNDPHAYVKLWKHHASQPQADKINRVAAERGESWLDIYGGKISCEWEFPKILETLEESPKIYETAARFLEAGDWLAWMLTGKESHCICFAGYKACWNSESGYPTKEFFAAVDPRMEDIIGTKVCDRVNTLDETAGVINDRGAEITGLCEGTPVALSMTDGHVAMAGINITSPGELMIIMGTSSCHMVHSDKKISIPGICGYANVAVVPKYYTYEAGQACVGDGFDRFVKRYVSESYAIEAREKGINLHKLLREKAKNKRPGESGLLCLDWFNGNRSVLVDSDLSGVILGLTLTTKPEDIYRAMIEGTAYGTRMIIDTFIEAGIEINGICACGGIARKDEMMMQIYADVTGREIRIAGTTQAAALASSMYASVAGGIYADITEAAAAMSKPYYKTYIPDPENHRIYSEIYEEYKKLHDYFGKGENAVMKKLLKYKR